MPTPVTDPRVLGLLNQHDKLTALREQERQLRGQLDDITNLMDRRSGQPAPTAPKPVTDAAVLKQLEPERRGFASGLARSFEQGATLGFGDELNAAVRAGYGSLTGSQPFSEGYGIALADERAANAEFAAKNPAIDFATQFAGGMLPGLVAPGLAGVNYVRRAGTAMQAGRRAGAVGAGYAGVAGFGAGQGGVENRAASGAISAPFGFGLGAALGYGGHRLGEAIGGYRQARTEVDPQSGAYNVIAKNFARDRIEPAQLRADILPPAGRTVTQDMIAQMARLADEGRTQQEIAQQLNVSADTVGRHVRAFQGRNTTPLTITDRAALRGPGSGANTQWTMRAAAATPGEARMRAAEAFTERQLGQSQRVADAVQRSFGDGDLEGRIAQLQAGLREQEQNAYRAAYKSEQPFDLSETLTSWQRRVNPGFERGQVRGRMAEGNTPLSRTMNRAIGAFFDEVDVPRAAGKSFERGFFPVRDLERFQRAKEALDHEIELSFKDRRPTVLTRQLQQFKKDVMKVVGDSNPRWKEANDLFFDGRAGDRALALGEGVALRMGQASRAALKQFEQMDEAQQELFRHGFSRRLQDMLANKTFGGDVTATLRTPAARNMIQRILERRGNQVRTAESRREAARFLRILDEEAAGTRTFRSLQGSQTTPLREAVDDLNAPAYLTNAASFLNPRALGQEVLSQAARRVYEQRNNSVLELLSNTDPVRQIEILDSIGRYSAARGRGGASVMRGAPASNALSSSTVRGLVGQTPYPAFDASAYDDSGNRRAVGNANVIEQRGAHAPPAQMMLGADDGNRPPGMMRLGGPKPPAGLPQVPFGAMLPQPGWEKPGATTLLAPGAELRNGPPVGMRDRMADWLGSAIGGDAEHARSNYQAADALSLLPVVGGPLAAFEGGQMIGRGLNAASPATVAGGAALAGFGPFGMLRRGRGAAKGVQEEIAKLEAELAQLAAQTRHPRLAQSLSRIMERPRPVPGTSAKELRDYDIAYRDRLRNVLADERQAIQSARYGMPRTSVPTPTGDLGALSTAVALRDKINANPFVQAIPGRRGFPTKTEQRALVEQMLPAPPPMKGPWTSAKPVDPRAITDAEKALLSRTIEELKAIEAAKRKPPPKS